MQQAPRRFATDLLGPARVIEKSHRGQAPRLIQHSTSAISCPLSGAVPASCRFCSSSLGGEDGQAPRRRRDLRFVVSALLRAGLLGAGVRHRQLASFRQHLLDLRAARATTGACSGASAHGFRGLGPRSNGLANRSVGHADATTHEHEVVEYSFQIRSDQADKPKGRTRSYAPPFWPETGLSPCRVRRRRRWCGR